jgi:peptide/nickel transport system substrate-binding protein
MRRTCLRVLVLTLIAILPTACKPAPREAKLVYGLTLSPSTIDPHMGASSELGIPLTSVYDPLVWLSPSGEFVPGLAERWEVSADGKTYTFYLRQDVKFHDGTPFNAQAVCFNLERIVDPATKSAKAIALLGPFERCEALDDYTAQVSLATAYAPFLSAASQVYLAMTSPTAVQKWGQEYQFHQVGTGPFRFKEYAPKDHLTLVSNPEYAWAPSFFEHQGPPYLQEIEFRFFVDPATRAPALESGQVDVMGEIPPVDAARLESDPQFAVVSVAVPGQPLQVYMNISNAPLNDLSVRQALLYATDRQAIVDTVFMGYSPPAYGPLCRATWGYDQTVGTLYPYDLDHARQMLEQAGWRDLDGNGIREKGGQELTLQTILMEWGFMPEVGQMLQAQYREAGVALDIQILPYPAAVQAAAEGKHHLIPFTFSSSDPDILRSSFHSSNADGGFNWSKVRDAYLDDLLDRGMQTLDDTERLAIYADIQQYIMEQALIIPIRDYVNLNGISARVKGLHYDAQGWFPWLYDTRIDPSVPSTRASR